MISNLQFVAREYLGVDEDNDGEDGFGGIATRFAHCEDIEVPIYGYPVRPRHSYWVPPLRASEEQPRRRSPQATERARLARIMRRRNGR